jgi:hypothetical protein
MPAGLPGCHPVPFPEAGILCACLTSGFGDFVRKVAPRSQSRPSTRGWPVRFLRDLGCDRCAGQRASEPDPTSKRRGGPDRIEQGDPWTIVGRATGFRKHVGPGANRRAHSRKRQPTSGIASLSFL